MSLIADLVRAGVDAELVGRVADEIARARAEGAAEAVAAPSRTARQDRNQRYYEARKERLKASEGRLNQTIKTVSDAELQPARDAPAHEGAPAEILTSKTTTRIIKTPPSEGQKSRPDQRCRIASDAQPDEKDREIVQEFGLDQPTFRHEWAAFRAHHAGRGSTMANWHEAWRKWLLGWVRDGRKPALNGHPVRAGPEPPKHANGVFAALARSRSHANPNDPPSRQSPDPDPAEHGACGPVLAYEARSAR